MVDNKFLPKLSQNLLEILDDDQYYDITIEVGNDPYVKIFRAHMVILNYRSHYLRRILSTYQKKNDGTLTHIKLPNILPEPFQIILRYIYGGRLTLEDYSTSEIIKILLTANELSLQELTPHLQSFLIKNKATWMEQNFDYIYQLSTENVSFFELQNYCNDLISKKPERIFKSLNFHSIPKQLLVTLIQHDNLQMNEVQVWEHVIKWGIAQNPELPSDLKRYSKDDFDVLKDCLQPCIPFIKFYNFTSQEFSDKVSLYKNILPEELYTDLLEYFLRNQNKKSKSCSKRIGPLKIDSKIITFQHAELISKWIDRLEITDKIKNSYEFKLMLRGSRDGFISNKFHEICDNQSHTVSIIKVKGTDEILGGYNPIVWKSNSTWSATKDSFIFSFKGNDKIENYVLSRVMDEKKAVYNGFYYGPSFSYGDLTLLGHNFNDSFCKKRSYKKPIRKTDDKFFVEEYEVFQVII